MIRKVEIWKEYNEECGSLFLFKFVIFPDRKIYLHIQADMCLHRNEHVSQQNVLERAGASHFMQKELEKFTQFCPCACMNSIQPYLSQFT